MSEPSCPNCYTLRSKVWLAWQCERCGWIEGASQVHEVYDAAMALLDKCSELGYESVYYPGHQLDLLLPHLDVMLDACRRTKEGR